MGKGTRFLKIVKCRYSLLRLAVIVMAFTGLVHAQDTLHVLFLGNSYTYFNGMPQMFEQLSLSGGEQVVTDMNAPGGYTLEGHSTNAISLERINLGTWDYVVLQEQSQIPTIDYWRYNRMYPAARVLDSLITSHNQNTAFFMTWGRKYGGQQIVGGYASPVFVDFFHMQDSLSAAYTQITNELSATLCPVGNAWATAVTMDSTVDLWQGDNSHPTIIGSYLAACVFYAVFFQSSPVGLEYTAGLPIEDAMFLQTVATQTVLAVSNQPEFPPLTFTLYQNYPNPFNNSTTISYFLQCPTHVLLQIFNILGQEVTTLIASDQPRGPHSTFWNATDRNNHPVSTGNYILRIQIGNSLESRKMLYLK